MSTPKQTSISTAPRRKQKVVISPEEEASLKTRMSVEPAIVDELLLVCGVLGTLDEETGLFVPVEDCLQWLQDLQRALRRDDDMYRPISLLLGQWKVVSQKLIPLVLSCRHDTKMLQTICKILVILTKPLADNTMRAGRLVIDTKKKGSELYVLSFLLPMGRLWGFSFSLFYFSSVPVLSSSKSSFVKTHCSKLIH